MDHRSLTKPGKDSDPVLGLFQSELTILPPSDNNKVMGQWRTGCELCVCGCV